MTPPKEHQSSEPANSRCRTRMARIFIRSFLRIKNRRRSTVELPGANSIQIGSSNRQSQEIKIAAYSSMARAAGPGRSWSRALLFKIRRRVLVKKQKHQGLVLMRGGRRRRRLVLSGREKKEEEESIDDDEEEEDDMQIERLREVVPGGEAMELGELLEEAAHYMRCLATQVMIMQTVADHFTP